MQKSEANFHPIVVMGPEPTKLVCPSCQSSISTRIEHVPTTKTHFFATWLLCCWMFCACCIPYCIKSCKNANHYCPKCDAYLGRYTL